MYQCSVDGIDRRDNIRVSWLVNGTSSTSPSFKPYTSEYRIMIDGAGSVGSILTVPGNLTLNMSTILTVQCVAQGEEFYIISSRHTLHIQGKSC